MTTEPFKPNTAAPMGQEPLVEFKGKLKVWSHRTQVFQPQEGDTNQQARPTTFIKFEHTDVEVIEAVEPYPFPIAYIEMPYSEPQRETARGNTRWDAFTASLRRIYGSAVPLDDLVGHMLHWRKNPAMLNGRNPDTRKFEVTEGLAWQLLDVDGQTSIAGNGSGAAQANSVEELLKYIAEKAEGKTETELYQALLIDARIRQNPDIVTAVTDRKILDLLMNPPANLLTRDAEGLLHRAAAAPTA